MARFAATVLLVLGAGLLVASPAQAVSYRDVKSVKYGRCLYAYSDPVEGIRLTSCSTTPAKYGNWVVTNAGFYNTHPLWILKRQSGTCLSIDGTASSNYLYSGCVAAGSKDVWRDVWEVFTTSSNHYVLKSFGAYKSWGKHECLTFSGLQALLGSCSLTSTVDQIYK